MILRLTLSLLLLCAPFGTGHAALSYDAALEWKTLNSQHFTLHYHDGEEQQAQTVLAIAERVHARLSPLFHWTPAAATEIVLSDRIDLHNGSATPFPANRMVLYLSTPDTIDGLEDHASAMETLIAHEYVHILQLDKASAGPLSGRRLFGRFPLFFPGMLQPAWLLEGLATYYETDPARAIGRGQSSYYDMLMRTEYSCGLKPLRQINQPLASWPAGHVPYLYGVHYYQFVAQDHGPAKPQALVDHYSANLIPFRINDNTEQVLGQELDGLWPGFEAYLERRYQATLEQLRAAGPVTGQRLTRHGYAAGAARALADGSIIYQRLDGASAPALLRLRPGAEKAEMIAELHPGARFDVHEQAGIVIAQPELHRNANLFYDLYRIDPESGAQRRLTTAGRYRYAAWSPEGRRLATVHNHRGRNALHLLDADGKLIEVLWQGESGVTLAAPDWSPDGKTLVLSIWRPATGWNLEQFDLGSRTFKRLTDDAAIEAQPQFTPDGRAVLFSADYGGIYNLQRLQLDSGEITRLSRTEGGAFQPSQGLTDGPIVYTGYDCGGFDIYRLDQPQALAVVETQPGASGIPLPEAPPLQNLTHSDYSPYASLRPRWWFPHLLIEEGRSEIGLITSASDSLNRHNYLLDAAYDVDNQLIVGAFDYIYDRFFPVLKLHGERQSQPELDAASNLSRLRTREVYQAEVMLPFFRYAQRFSLHTAVLTDKESDAWLAPGIAALPERQDNLLGLAAIYDSSRRYPLSISRSDGVRLEMTAEDSDAIGDSDYSGQVYSLDGHAYLGLGSEHVLALRLAGGWGDAGTRPFRLGGASESQPGALFNQRSYALRGYPKGLAQFYGNNMALGSLEWRFPMRRVERGFMSPPLALHQLSGAAFIDSGDAWREGERRDFARSAGLELHAEIVPFYGFIFERLLLRIGYAHGFDTGGGDEVYLNISAPY